MQNEAKKMGIAQRTEGEATEVGCCGGAAPAGVEACCVLDAEVKAEGGAGCGCSTSAAPLERRCC